MTITAAVLGLLALSPAAFQAEVWENIGASGPPMGINVGYEPTPKWNASEVKALWDAPRNRLVVVWKEVPNTSESDGPRIQARQWDGDVWRPLGASPVLVSMATPQQSITTLDAAVDANGRLVFAYGVSGTGVTARLRAASWDGTTLRDWVGSSGPEGILAFNEPTDVALTLDAAGEPIVVCIAKFQGGSALRVGVARPYGSVWRGFNEGTPDPLTSGDSTYSLWRSFITRDSRGRIVAAWSGYMAASGGLRDDVFHAARYDALDPWAGWVPLGAGISEVARAQNPFATASAQSMSMAVDRDDRVLLCWIAPEGPLAWKIMALRRDEATGVWTGPGGSFPDVVAHHDLPAKANLSMMVDGQNRPWIACSMLAGVTADIRAYRWAAGAWSELSEAGPAPAPGVCQTSPTSDHPSIAAGADGDVIVAWQEENGAPAHHGVCVRRHRNRAPAAGALEFRSLDGSTAYLATTPVVEQPGVLLRVGTADPDLDSMTLKIRIKPIGTPFGQGDPVIDHAGPSDALFIDHAFMGLDPGLYQAEVKLIDAYDLATDWVPVGSDEVSEPDLWIRANLAPEAGLATQMLARDGSELRAGAALFAGDRLRFRLVAVEPDEDRWGFELGFQRAGSAFDEVVVATSGFADSGEALLLEAVPPEGSDAWWYNPFDEYGRHGGWTPFGAGDGPDFLVRAAGSGGNSCQSSAGGSAVLVAMALLMLISRRNE